MHRELTQRDLSDDAAVAEMARHATQIECAQRKLSTFLNTDDFDCLISPTGSEKLQLLLSQNIVKISFSVDAVENHSFHNSRCQKRTGNGIRFRHNVAHRALLTESTSTEASGATHRVDEHGGVGRLAVAAVAVEVEADLVLDAALQARARVHLDEARACAMGESRD